MCNSLTEEINTLRNEVDNVRRRESIMVQDWYNDTKQALQDLVEANSKLSKANEVLKDEQISTEIERDEERARNLMLQEDISRMEQETQILRNRLNDAIKDKADRYRYLVD